MQDELICAGNGEEIADGDGGGRLDLGCGVHEELLARGDVRGFLHGELHVRHGALRWQHQVVLAFFKHYADFSRAELPRRLRMERQVRNRLAIACEHSGPHCRLEPSRNMPINQTAVEGRIPC